MRYATLAALNTKKLQELFLQRHQLAVALIAERIATPPARHTGRDFMPGVPKQAEMDHRGQASGAARAAQYAVQPADTLQSWLQRVCEQLPVLKATKQSQPTLKEGVLAFDTPHRVPRSALHLPGSQRVAYQQGLAYPEFVAAMGVQVGELCLQGRTEQCGLVRGFAGSSANAHAQRHQRTSTMPLQTACTADP